MDLAVGIQMLMASRWPSDQKVMYGLPMTEMLGSMSSTSMENSSKHLGMASRMANRNCKPAPPVVVPDYRVAGPGSSPMDSYSERGIAVGSNGDIWVARLLIIGSTSSAKKVDSWAKSTTVQKVGQEPAMWMNQSEWRLMQKVMCGSRIAANARVDEFNEKREFIKAFGFGVLDGASKLEVCTTTCRTGLKGKEAGELSSPYGIATRNGYVWVSDIHNDRIVKFTEKGEYVAQFGTEGTGNGQFKISGLYFDGQQGGYMGTDWPR